MKKRVVISALLLLCLNLEAQSYPYQWLSLGVSEDMSRVQRVSWRTSTEFPTAKAQIAPMTASPNISSSAKIVDVVSTQEDDYSVKNIYHLATFDSLTPNTKYLYRIGDGAKEWSEWFEFKSANDKSTPFSFIYMADVQEGIMTHYPRVIRKAQRVAPDASLIIFTGDLTGRATQREFNDFFTANGWLFAHTPVAVIPDNHEYATNAQGVREKLTTLWGHMFNYPRNTPAQLAKMGNYIFDYQGCRFVMINTKEFCDGTDEYVASMLSWMDQVLRENKNQWLIVAQHQPVYSVADGRSSKDMEKYLRPLYQKYGVDVVLSGHDHVYSRVTTAEKAPIYISSNAGSQVYVPAYHTYTDRIGSDMQLFQVIDISNEQILFRAYDATGELYDAFALKQTISGKSFVDMTPHIEERTNLPVTRRGKYDHTKWQQIEEQRKKYLKDKKLLKFGSKKEQRKSIKE